ncbi:MULTISPECIES: hypothetical protein [unclassified Empedobacter]|nr:MULTISPECIES: hypothetical protein [unclassified Empedobacter]MDM1137214.1 hypothetical protein [Empedobacter sp. R132-2]
MDIEINKEELNDLVDKLYLLTEDYKNLAKEIFKYKAMKVDFIALSILNRAMSINEGFRLLFQENNFYSATHLIRIQMDNLIRYNSILVAKDDSYIDYILDGKEIRKFRDSILKKNFNDAYLVEQISKKFPEIKILYKKYCGFIHFSNEHLERIKTFPNIENVKFRVEIGNFENYSHQEKVEIVSDMITISLFIFNQINYWTEAKKTIK